MSNGEPTSDVVVAALRAEISCADRGLVASRSRRIRAVSALHEYKVRRGIKLFDPRREADVLADMQQSSSGPLSTPGVAEFGAFVLALSKREAARARR